MSFARALAAQPDFHIDPGDTFMTGQRYYFGLISQRKRCFHNPRPDGFYSGNAAQDPVDGLLENYYAWEWGDGLFIVADLSGRQPDTAASSINWFRTPAVRGSTILAAPQERSGGPYLRHRQVRRVSEGATERTPVGRVHLLYPRQSVSQIDSSICFQRPSRSQRIRMRSCFLPS